MRLVLCIHVLGTVVAANITSFELIRGLSHLDLFQEFSLGPQCTYNHAEECASDCVRNPQCSMFSFNQAAETCQLYGDVVYPDLSLAQSLPGTRYFAYRTDWCPLKSRFFMFRSVNMCINIRREKLDFVNASRMCDETGSHLVVLEEEDKATAVVQVLTKLGLDFYYVYVGADDMANEGEFVWADGRKIIRNWWLPNEPNDQEGEDCAVIMNGGLNDLKCTANEKFICEISS